MKRLFLVTALALSICPAFAAEKTSVAAVAAKPAITATEGIPADVQSRVVSALVKKHGETHRARIEAGVAQAAPFWRAEDGTAEEFEKFCLDSFIVDPVLLKETFDRFETNFESINGYFHRLTRDLKRQLDLDIGDNLPLDESFAKLDPFNHLQDDLFRLKIAFIALLNFPQTTLTEKLKNGPSWSREQWARTRLCDAYTARVPSAIRQKINDAEVEAESYVNDYNIFAGNLLTPEKKTIFAPDLKLISHWGLRDHLSTLYAQADGLIGQEMLFKVMERIIDQSIPKAVINRPTYWDPVSNTVYEKSGSGFKQIDAAPEPDTRYATMLINFHAQQLADPLYPKYPRYIDRKFNLERQISETDVEKLLISLISSDAAARTGELISKKIGRKLRPFDLWYSGFKVAGELPEKELNQTVKNKYPNLQAFASDIPSILKYLGFEEQTAKFIAGRIAVEPARGGGHATPAMMRTDRSHLRTRVPKGGMDYQGFDTAMHELGHCTEQTISLYKTDHYLLGDVPNSACTECFAFLFQSRGMDVIGMKLDDPSIQPRNTLDTFWSAYEIAGVSLVDLRVWRWLYDHPEATPAQLKEAVISIAKEVWNAYYAPVFGFKDSTVL
ncbi:MAG TPA: hypothetical protein PKM25_13420, partial [Candidatus Ozemobacteraceae bacterium]|nr:hypothetical protein [Candidatus Ozemobacteraceae bacterium]